MKLHDLFFSNNPSQPPQLGGAYVLLLLLYGLVVFLSIRNYQSAVYRRVWLWVQGIQVISLILWYIMVGRFWKEGIPLYHCRLAMFALLFLPARAKLRHYFALLGSFGSLVAFIYPVFDPFPFPHITILSFIIGHLALAANSIHYVMREYQSDRFSPAQLVLVTIALNLVIEVFVIWTGGAYGFMRKPPLIGNHGLFTNFMLVTIVLSLALVATHYFWKQVFKIFPRKKVE